jgi:hypothetical protein
VIGLLQQEVFGWSLWIYWVQSRDTQMDRNIKVEIQELDVIEEGAEFKIIQRFQET